jgi:hypothetical protein
VLLGLVLAGSGLMKTVFFERTPDAVSNARTGNLLLLLGCLTLTLAAVAAYGAGPRWAALAIATPVVVCGGLALYAGETLLPQIAALPAFAAAMAGVVGVAVHSRA